MLEDSSIVEGSEDQPSGHRRKTATAEAPEQDAIECKRADLIKAFSPQPKLHTSEDVQYELGRWINIIRTAERGVLICVLPSAEVALGALSQEGPMLKFARTLRYRLEMELLRNNGWFMRRLVGLSDGDPAVFVGAGVSLTMLMGVIGYALVHLFGLLPFDVLAPADWPIITVMQAAFLGGGVSILARLRDFSSAKVRDFEPLFLLWNAIFNPIVAVIFGGFAYAGLKSGLVPLGKEMVGAATTGYGLWVLGFLSGFSERFTSDIISRSEGLLPTSKKT
jgi:hypothetical protein